MAEQTFSAIVWSLRERKRAKSAALSTSHSNGFVDGGHNGPASLSRVRDTAGEVRERRVIGESSGGKIQQPGTDYAAAAPNFGNVREIDVIDVVIPDRRGFGVGLAFLEACVGVCENVEAFAKGGHDAVFDAIVHHLDEVTGA